MVRLHYEGCSLISATGLLLGNLHFHLNQSTRMIKYGLFPIIITENQRSFPVQFLGLATVVP